MWGVQSSARVYLCLGDTDMRKSINSLSVLVEHELKGDLTLGDLFVFSNRVRSIIKILYWHRNGFCLWHKRLERSRFKWPSNEREVQEIDQNSLGWLLDGLDIAQAHQRLHNPRSV